MDEILLGLTDRDNGAACALARALTEESRASNRLYPCMEDFFGLLSHKNSLVRNRAIALIAANARWDTDGIVQKNLPRFLLLLKDPKPITVRQGISALAEIAAAQPRLIPAIQNALFLLDTSAYPDSMRPLIEKDVQRVLEQCKNA